MKILTNVPDSEFAKGLLEQWNEGKNEVDNPVSFVKEVFVYESVNGTIYESKPFTQEDMDYFDSDQNAKDIASGAEENNGNNMC